MYPHQKGYVLSTWQLVATGGKGSSEKSRDEHVAARGTTTWQLVATGGKDFRDKNVIRTWQYVANGGAITISSNNK